MVSGKWHTHAKELSFTPTLDQIHVLTQNGPQIQNTSKLSTYSQNVEAEAEEFLQV